jgi:hypothetical protein
MNWLNRRRAARSSVLVLLGSMPLLTAAWADEPGFKPIFNGKDLTGWRLGKTDLSGKTATDDGRFAVKDGALAIGGSMPTPTSRWTPRRVRYFARVDRARAREFLTRDQDRILYATDFSLREGDPASAAKSLQATHDRGWDFFSQGDEMEYAGRRARGLELPAKVLRKIFREDALRWLPGLGA